MSQLLALEWNGSEARVVVAVSRGEKVVIEQAFSATLRSEPSGEEPSGEEAAEVDVGQRIAAALAARGIGRIDTLVAVGRSSIELRQLSLPPAPEEELPDLVSFQAIREFNELDENWLLDFVPIDEPTDGPRNVRAAAIGPDLVAQIEQTCQTAGLKPRRLILRPCAAASLLGRQASTGPARPRLLVDLLSDEVDLTVMIDRRVIFVRTARMTGDPLQDDDYRGVLLGEIRRTIAAAQNQLSGQRVESIVLCGTDEQHAALAKQIQQKLGTSTELFDPFDGLQLSRELRRTLPPRAGRFAPLLGMALAELEDTGHAIDFLDPRRRPEPPRRNTKYILAGAVVAMLVTLFFVYGRFQSRRLATEKKNLEAESSQLDKAIAKARKMEENVKRIEQWTANDVVWLDELYELSQDFPSAKRAMLTDLSFGPGAPGGTIDIDGRVDKSSTIGTLLADLRDESHRAESTGSGAQPVNDYSWWFKSLVHVEPEKP